MTTGNAPTIIERIANYLGNGGLWNPEAMEHDKVRELLIDCRDCLAALESQPVPVEPGFLPVMRKLAAKNLSGSEDAILIRYIDSLQSALQTCKHNSSVTMDELGEMRDALQRAQENPYWQEEARRYASNSDYWQERAEKAEATIRRMVELLKEPSEGMINAGYPPNDERAQSWGVTEVFKAMSEQLLKEVGE